MRNLGQPELSIVLDEQKMGIYGVTTADANSVIEMAIGGKSASTFYQQERKFDIRIRYPEQYRNNESAIGDLRVPTIHGSKIPLKEIAEIKTITGPAFVYRDRNTRFIAIKFTIRDRDMGSTIAEAQEKVDDQISLGKGFSMEWAGEFENQVRAQADTVTGCASCTDHDFYFTLYKFWQWPGCIASIAECALCHYWWHIGASCYRNSFQYLCRYRFYCVIWNLYPERCDPNFRFQTKPASQNLDSAGCDAGRAIQGATRCYDRIDGCYWFNAGCRFKRYRK